MSEVIELVTKCNKCKRPIPDGCAYYKHPVYGIVCEYCPEFADGGLEAPDDMEGESNG